MLKTDSHYLMIFKNIYLVLIVIMTIIFPFHISAATKVKTLTLDRQIANFKYLLLFI
jgi:hypothetical protein